MSHTGSVVFFFFSSRRRHTRYWRDWSSDVCSSDLQPLILTNGELASIDSSNPLISVRGLGGYAKSQTKMNTITANLQYELPWVKGLSVYLKGTVDDNSMIQKNFYKPVALYKWDKDRKSVV